ncbi:MAG: tetratricopeptide repeat protein [Longimicrobiales bacterium]
MSGSASLFQRVRAFYLAHERAILGAYLAGVLLLGVLMVLPQLRNPMLETVARVLAVRDARWSAQVASGERLLQAGLYEEAASYLSELDRRFPARVVKHRRDTERERLLRSLGDAYAALDRKRLALDAYARLAAFDPQNYRNHVALADAALAFDEPELAELHVIAALAIHPNHLPSVTRHVELLFERGDFAGVTAAYERYLDAYWLHGLIVEVAGVPLPADVPVDGRYHTVRIGLPARLALTANASALIDTKGLFAEVAELGMREPLRPGIPGRRQQVARPAVAAWEVPFDLGQERGAPLRIELAEELESIEEVWLVIRLPKPVDSNLWTMVEKSYRNRLDADGLAAARARSQTLPASDPASAIRFRE